MSFQRLLRTLKFLWGIYTLFTLVVATMLVAAGTSVFDAVTHSFTCLSTGGYSPYDASIGHYGEVGYLNYKAIEYILIGGMLLGGINFMVHFQVLTGKLRALWDSMEMRMWWLIVGGATLIVTFGQGHASLVVVTIPENARVCGRTINEVDHSDNFPTDCVIAGIYREKDNRFIFPRGSVELQPGDMVYLGAPTENIREAADYLHQEISGR